MSAKDSPRFQKQRTLRAGESFLENQSLLQDAPAEMSEKVQSLAREVYAQLEKLIKKYDQHVVEELMPLVVSILEVLDSTNQENEVHKAELEILREDNEQLLTQYEREKEHRKQLDKKNIEIEDVVEEEKRKQQDKMESLETLVRMLEMKAKNATDQVNRLEDKEREGRKEFEKLHDRYTQLFKSHADHIERTRILLGSAENLTTQDPIYSAENDNQDEALKAANQELDETALFQRSNAVMSAVEEKSRASMRIKATQRAASESMQIPTSAQLRHINAASYSEMNMEQEDMESGDASEKRQDLGSDTESDLGTSESDRQRTGDRAESDAASGRFPFGISREVEKLIVENNDLLAMKNALNVVKDDLIAQVDELSSEKEMMREEIQSLQDVKGKLKERIALLEDNLRRMRDYYETKLTEATREEENLPNDQQKRFTRMEMSRLVMEKNKYKEQLMELQDQMRIKEISMQVPRRNSRSRTGLWKFFNNLFGSANSRETSSIRYHSENQTSPANSTASRSPPPPMEVGDFAQIMDLQESLPASPSTSSLSSPARPKSASKSSQGSSPQTHGGRVQAYGWSIPADLPKSEVVPFPIYCRPLLEKDPDMKIWCAVDVPRRGNDCIDLISSNESQRSENPLSSTPSIARKADLSARSLTKESTSRHIWICSSTHSAGKVSIIDANKPNDVLESFNVCSSHLLCITCVPGVQKSDFPTLEEKENLRRASTQSSVAKNTTTSVPTVGEIVFVECASGSNAPPPALDEMLGDSSGPQDLLSENEKSCDSNPALEETIWIGSEKGGLHVYSANREQRRRLWKVNLADQVLCIVHIRGRVFASLADGTVAIFNRADNGSWDTWNYHLLNLGKPDHAVRCMVAVRNESVWCACRNKVYVADPVSLQILNTFEGHSRQDATIKTMVWIGQGVWISIRLDNTVRLFHALTHQHLQDLHIEPLASLMTGKSRLGLSLIRITAMSVSCLRLWIGTSTGVVINVPFTAGPESSTLVSSAISSGNFESDDLVPFCNPKLAQISFHGFGKYGSGEVKFFVSVPGFYERRPSAGGATSQLDLATAQKRNSLSDECGGALVMSGGEGYIDFRYDDDSASVLDEGDSANRNSAESRRQILQTPSRTSRSHLVVWQIPGSFF